MISRNGEEKNILVADIVLISSQIPLQSSVWRKKNTKDNGQTKKMRRRNIEWHLKREKFSLRVLPDACCLAECQSPMTIPLYGFLSSPDLSSTRGDIIRNKCR